MVKLRKALDERNTSVVPLKPSVATSTCMTFSLMPNPAALLAPPAQSKPERANSGSPLVLKGPGGCVGQQITAQVGAARNGFKPGLPLARARILRGNNRPDTAR